MSHKEIRKTENDKEDMVFPYVGWKRKKRIEGERGRRGGERRVPFQEL